MTPPQLYQVQVLHLPQQLYYLQVRQLVRVPSETLLLQVVPYATVARRLQQYVYQETVGLEKVDGVRGGGQSLSDFLN